VLVVLECKSHKALPDRTLWDLAQIPILWAKSLEEAQSALQQGPCLAFASNDPFCPLFLQDSQPNILFTDLPLKDYYSHFNQRHIWPVRHIIALRYPWVLIEMRVCLESLKSKEFFGLERYLKPAASIHSSSISSTRSREGANVAIEEYAKELKLPSSLVKNIRGVSEELLMNAVFDAPESTKLPEFANRKRDQDYPIEERHRPLIRYGCDLQVFAVSVEDPFGSYTPQSFYEYLRKVTIKDNKNEDIIDRHKEGAGLGLLRTYFAASSLVCSVDQYKRTEVTVLFDLSDKQSSLDHHSRSIHFYMNTERTLTHG
jgi:hypothetical protein